MCDAAGELANGFHLLRLTQPFLKLSLCGDILQRTDHAQGLPALVAHDESLVDHLRPFAIAATKAVLSAPFATALSAIDNGAHAAKDPR
jgi:hypothetical protein